jgi:hypothetical protein
MIRAMSDKNIQIAQHEADTLFLYAFRYALGRSTYASAEMAELIVKYKDSISKGVVDLIMKEISDAINKNQAGMDCDKKVWEEMLEEFWNE